MWFSVCFTCKHLSEIGKPGLFKSICMFRLWHLHSQPPPSPTLQQFFNHFITCPSFSSISLFPEVVKFGLLEKNVFLKFNLHQLTTICLYIWPIFYDRRRMCFVLMFHFWIMNHVRYHLYHLWCIAIIKITSMFIIYMYRFCCI